VPLLTVISNSRRWLLCLLAVSFAAKLLYVFWLTDYSHYLFSDFLGYWDRALGRLQGSDLHYSQWAVWPPLPHIALGGVFRVIDLFGLSAHRLEVVLIGNALLSTASVAFLYGIVLRLAASSRVALLVAAMYAFAFPLLYLNAFVMSEHPATAALLAAVWLLVRFPGHLGYVGGAGAVLAFAVGLRPAFGLIAVPCGLFVLLAGPFARVSISRAIAFSVGFALVIGGVVAEVGRISGGQLRGLSGNGGINFYFAQCRTHQVTSRYASYEYYLIPPATVDLPENGRVVVDRPFHDQGFFTALGWRCVRAQSGLWWRNVGKFHDLFFGPLLPSVNSAWGFGFLLPPFRWLALAMTLVLPLGLVVGQRARRRDVAALLGGIVAVSLATQYAFNAEHRYVYPLLGCLLALNAWIAVELYRLWSRVRKPALIYGTAIGVIALCFGAYALVQQLRAPTLIEAEWFQTAAPFERLPREAGGKFAVDTLRFPDGNELRHAVRGSVALPVPLSQLAIRFTACLQVDTPGRFEFAVASDDGFELRIDNRPVTWHHAVRAYGATRGMVDLTSGRHRYSLLYSQSTGRLGVTGVWRRAIEDGAWMPAVGLRDVGDGGDGVKFLLPAACDPNKLAAQ